MQIYNQQNQKVQTFQPTFAVHTINHENCLLVSKAIVAFMTSMLVSDGHIHLILKIKSNQVFGKTKE